MRVYCVLAVFMLLGRVASGGQFHVSPAGAPSGNGSSHAPWDLRTAFLHPPTVQPGDTIWLHRGIYTGSFISNLSGAPGNPILVRAYPGEGVALDGGNSQQDPILFVRGSYVWYWGFEVYSSDLTRAIEDSGSFPSPAVLPRGVCVSTEQAYPTYGNKFINLILHDGFGGFSAWVPANTELYGSVIYNNGWDAPDRPHGHGIYIQNAAGDERKIIANIIWGAFDNNIQAYGTRNIDDFYLEKNVIFAHQGNGRDLLIGGGGGPAKNPRVISNYTYEPSSVRNLDLGWEPEGKGIDSGQVTGNFFFGGEMYVQRPITNTVISDNRFYTSYSIGFTSSDSLSNTFFESAPHDTVVLIPNVYERGRANIAVYNWSMQAFVPVDVAGILLPGEYFEICDAQNYFGDPVASGIYRGGSIALPMVGLTAVSPIGKPGSRAHTAPKFGAFVVIKGGVPSVLGVREEKALPLGFELFQNYPNPFNPATTVEFRIQKSEFMTLKVYDLLGREVARLVNEIRPAGSHVVQWNAEGAPSGIYFYRLQSGGRVETRKMVLVR